MTFAFIDNPFPKPLEIDKERCLIDRSYLARMVLGFDYFKSESTGKVIHEIEWEDEMRPCGFVDWGPHGKMNDFFDDLSKAKVLKTTRGGLKTTGVVADIVQSIVIDPNIRILVHMELYNKAVETIRLVKAVFERNEKFRHVFGDQVGPKFTDTGIIVKRDRDSRDYTLSGSGTDKVITGNHVDKIYIDDPTSWQQAESETAMKKAIDAYKALIPILDPSLAFRIWSNLNMVDISDTTWSLLGTYPAGTTTVVDTGVLSDTTIIKKFYYLED